MSAFSIIEALDTEFHPSCGRCQCGSRPLGRRNCTIKEGRGMALIDRNLEFSGNGYWTAGYPGLNIHNIYPIISILLILSCYCKLKNI